MWSIIAIVRLAVFFSPTKNGTDRNVHNPRLGAGKKMLHQIFSPTLKENDVMFYGGKISVQNLIDITSAKKKIKCRRSVMQRGQFAVAESSSLKFNKVFYIHHRFIIVDFLSSLSTDDT